MSTNTLLLDRVNIADLFTRFARLLDEKRWADAGTVFTDDVVVHSPRGGKIHGIDKVVSFLQQAEVEGEHTQHITTDLMAEVDSDGNHTATSANSVVHFYRDGQAPHLTSGLRLTATAIRTPAGWRLREEWITLLWTREG